GCEADGQRADIAEDVERDRACEHEPRVNAERSLRLGPRFLYPAKAIVTRGRSALWAARSRGHAPAGDGVRILFYHRVSDECDELAVRRTAFATQMAALEDAGFRAVHVGEALDALWHPAAGSRVVGLSFDD